MDEEKKIPKMMELLFGEAAGQGAGKRLRWRSQAFDEWLEERKRSYTANTTMQAMLTYLDPETKERKI